MNVARVVLTTAALCFVTGCGAILHGTRQDINVQSSPAGTKIETNPVSGASTTPTTLNLERRNSYVLTFTSPGYTPATFNIYSSIGVGTVIADVLLTGIIGVVVDAATGAWYGLSPDAATVTLTRSGDGPGPETIHVQISATTNGQAVGIKSDVPGVVVQVKQK